MGRSHAKLRELLLELLPTDGSPKSNPGLRKELKVSDEVYFKIRDDLLDEDLIQKARGFGGSIRRVVKDAPCIEVPPVDASNLTVAEAAIVADYADEKALYAPMLDVLKSSSWGKERGFQNYEVEDTSASGTRASGKWSRPDMICVAKRSYKHLPGLHLDVITFEIKTYKNLDVTAVYEALAHKRFATESILLVWVPMEQASALEEMISDIRKEAARWGIGLLIAEDPADFSKWNILERAEQSPPDPERMEEAISFRLSQETKDKLLHWFKS